MRPRSARLAAALFAVTGLGACSSTPEEPEPTWSSREILAPSDRVLWKVVLQVLQTLDYPLGSGLDPHGMSVVTGWKTDLQPFSRAGHRTMAEVRMEPVARGRWLVEARVKKQMNEELARPLDPRYADWVWTQDDEEAARILVQHVRAVLDPAPAPGGPAPREGP